ncbi:MAG: hypothetical protein MUO95_03990 [Methanoregula sp.]|jgi:hypothetical protein|nr:hypothetical protein [Methanoregula sp.]
MVAQPQDLQNYSHRSRSCQEGIFSRDQKEKKRSLTDQVIPYDALFHRHELDVNKLRADAGILDQVYRQGALFFNDQFIVW